VTRPPTRLHPAATGFGRVAEAYERARPGYPAAAVRCLARALALGPRRTVVELACGTGKFTRALAPLGCAVVGVEPSPGMRAVFERTVPRVAVIAGTAEAIPLPTAIADAVVVAAAFHWFRPGEALREIARVVRPGGGLGLVWNTRDDSDGLSRRISEILRRYRGATPRNPGAEGTRGSPRGAVWDRWFRRPDGPFSPLRYRAFRHSQRLDRTGVVERVLSVSFIAVLPASERHRIVREVRGLLDRPPGGGSRRSFVLPYRTDVYWARHR